MAEIHRVMEVRQEDQIAININELLPGSFEDLMEKKLSLSPNTCIFRTPTILSRHNEQAYEPNAFSIGPFHHANKILRPTQKIKLKYLQDILSRSNNGKELYSKLDEAIRSVLGEVRECYAGSIEACDDKTFQKILLLDGCFILELFRKDAMVYKDKKDPIFSMSILQEFLNHDLILLENQIPWLVLERLFELTKVSDDKSLIQLALDFFSNIFSSSKPDIKPEQFQGLQIKHILDLLRHSLLIPMPKEIKLAKMSIEPNSNEPNSSGWEPLPCATKIQEAGIKFKNVVADSILDVRFQNGTLEIPTLLIQETTETIFRNLISFEQCCPNYLPVFTSYAKLMDNLIGTTKDVEILSENNILDNWLNPEDATQFFNKLYNDTYLKTFCYYDVCKQVKFYRELWWPRWRTFYIVNYFATPWAVVSQVVAVIFLILGVVQTLYAILSVVKN